jgi:microcystin-dependent protein
MSTTPYMNLTLPVPGETETPDWAPMEVEAFETVDAHDHTMGKGTPVPAAGLDIDSDLDIQENELLNVGAVNLVSLDASLPASSVQALQSIEGDLWYNNGDGTPVQITQGSSIASASSPLVPSGVIWQYGGSSAPTGFLLCNGGAISRTTYGDLFTAIGTTFGAGDGTTTFNLPNFNGRVAVGAGAYADPVSGSVTRTMGSSAGAEKHLLTTSEMPSHNHGGGNHQHFSISNPQSNDAVSSTNYLSRTADYGANYFSYIASGGATPATQGLTSASGTIISSNGGGTNHNNMQPYLVTNYIIKT